jgi:hypothetical protein
MDEKTVENQITLLTEGYAGPKTPKSALLDWSSDYRAFTIKAYHEEHFRGSPTVRVPTTRCRISGKHAPNTSYTINGGCLMLVVSC